MQTTPMLSMFLVTFPFFALIAAGYLCVTTKWVPVDAVRALNAFVLYVALPCMLFKFSAGLDIRALWNDPVVLLYGAAGLVVFVGLLWLGRLRGVAWRDLSFLALVGVFPNTGFMGVPLVVSIVGPDAATPAVAIVIFDMIVTSSLSVATSTFDGYGWSDAGRALAGALRGVLSNPMLGSMLVGITLAVVGWKPESVWFEPIWMMAAAATPVALFTIGGILARARSERTAEARRYDILPFIVAKLAVHPLVVLGVVTLSSHLGWQLAPWLGQTLILMAALPSASNVSFLAERMGGNAAAVAEVILWTTVGAFGTYSVWGWLVS
jgi:malonate transporter and related proteins